MITYKWTIDSLKCRPLVDGFTNVIEAIDWSLEATSDGPIYIENCFGTVNIRIDGRPTFIPFEDLTEEKVMEWLMISLGVYRIKAFEDSLSDRIGKLINIPPITLPLPWAE